MKWAYEFILCTLLFLLIGYAYKGQQRVTFNTGQGWDGTKYYKIADQIQKGSEKLSGEMPFIKRLGTPFLVATYSTISGNNLLDSALSVNLIGAYITILLFMFWLRLFIDAFWIRGLLLFLFMMSWFGPLRFLFYYPMITDPWGAAWFMAGLLLLYAMRKSLTSEKQVVFILYLISFTIAVTVGTLFRESNVVLAIVLFFIFNPFINLNLSSKQWSLSNALVFFRKTWNLYNRGKTLILFVPIISVIITNTIVSKFVISVDQNGYSYFSTILMWFYTKSFPAYILGILISFGPLFLLIPFYLKHFKSFLWENQSFLLLLLLSFFFGYIGGSDTERIVFWSGFPIVFVLIGIALKNISISPQKWWWPVLFFLQTIAYRFYWHTPDFPNNETHLPIPFFGLLGNKFQYLQLYSQFAHFALGTILFLEYFALFLVTWYVIHNKVTPKSFFSLNKSENIL